MRALGVQQSSDVLFQTLYSSGKKRGYGGTLNIHCVPKKAKITFYRQDEKHMDLTLTLEHTSAVLVFFNATISSVEYFFSDFKQSRDLVLLLDTSMAEWYFLK